MIGAADSGVLYLWSLGNANGAAREAEKEGTGWTRGYLRKRQLIDSRRVVSLAVLGVEGRGIAQVYIDYDVSCLNFVRAKTMRSGNIGNSCRALFRSKLRKTIKHNYADSRNACEV